ncbi:MAG TPA: hypothetical protein VH298_07415, partial [Jatrophihabitans sp.]|nr:hypothetical protein [Jatrophihabitans sp.]
KKTVRELVSRRAIAPDLPCPAGQCCSSGAQGLLGDSRQHTLYARVASLRQLAETDQRFRWSRLHTRAELGLDLARRINRVADQAGINRVSDAALRSIAACARIAHEHRRADAA